MTESQEKTFDRLALAATVLLYAVLEARRIDVPIPRFDECDYASPILRIVSLAGGGASRGWTLMAEPYVGWRGWPLMVEPYNGCPMSYFLAPFIGLWGLSVGTMRLPVIGVALAAVLILLYLISKIFPRLPLWAPAAACLLNSVFLISSRTGLYVDVSIHWLLLSLTLLCLWKWSLTRRPLLAFLAFLCVGFGIYSKIIFVWFAIPAVLFAAHLSRRDGRASRARLAGLCALGLFIGVLPLLIYNMETGWSTVTVILDHLVHPSDAATASNVSVFTNLATRWEHFRMLFSGDFLSAANPGRRFSGRLLLILFFASFLFPKKPQRASLAVAGAIIAAFFFGSMLTVSGRHPEHLYPILPLMLTLSGIALARLIPGRLPLLLACALLLLPQLKQFNMYMDAMAQGTNEGSPRALYSLSAFLSTAGIARPTALDWDLSYPLVVASGGKVAPQDDFSEPPPSLRAGDTAICFWKPSGTNPIIKGCGRLLNDASFTLGEIRKFPDAPEPPVYAAIRVRGVKRTAEASWQELMIRADRLSRKGKSAESLTAAEGALADADKRFRPDNRDVVHILALLSRLYASAKDSPRIPEMEIRLSAITSKNSEVWLALGRLLRYEEKSRAAEDTLMKALALKPDDPEAEDELIQVYEDQGRFEKELPLLKNILDKNPQAPSIYSRLANVYTRLGRTEEAKQMFARSKKSNGKIAEAYIAEGYFYLQSGRSAQAKEAFEKAVVVDTASPFGYHHLGSYYAKTQQYPESEKYLRQALDKLEANPNTSTADHVHALFMLGEVIAAQGRSAEAESVYLKGLEIAPPGTDQQLNLLVPLAKLYESEGRSAQAEETFKRAANACTVGSECRSGLAGGALIELGRFYLSQGRRSEAEAMAEQAEKFSLNAPIGQGLLDMLRGLSTLYASLGDVAQREALHTRLLPMRRKMPFNPDLVWVETGLAEMYAARGRLDEAEARFRQAIGIMEHNGAWNDEAGALSSLAEIYEEQGKQAAADEAKKRAEALSTRPARGG